MKKTALLLTIFVVIFALVVTGCPQPADPTPAPTPTPEPEPTPPATKPEINIETDNLMNVTGFEFHIDGAKLVTVAESHADYDEYMANLASILSVPGLKEAISVVFPTWTYEGTNYPYNQQQTIDVTTLSDLFEFQGWVQAINYNGIAYNATMRFYLDDRAFDNSDSPTAATFYGDCLVIDFDLPSRTPFTNIVFDYSTARTESALGGSAALVGDDIRTAVAKSIKGLGYTTFHYGETGNLGNDEDDFDGESNYMVVFAPDGGQQRVLEDIQASYNSTLAAIKTIDGINVSLSIDTVANRSATGASGAIPSLIVTVAPRRTYTVPSAPFVEEQWAPTLGGYTVGGNISINTAGNYSSNLSYEITAVNTPEGLGSVTIAQARAAVTGILDITDIRGQFNNNLPTSDATYAISAVTLSGPISYNGSQPDGDYSTIDLGESVTFSVAVTYTISGRVSTSTPNSPYYSFNANSEVLTRTTTFNVVVANNN